MTKDLIKDYFGISDTEFEKIWHNASKIVEKIMSETENGDDTNSYYNSVHEKYKDNKLVEKREKELYEHQEELERQFAERVRKEIE